MVHKNKYIKSSKISEAKFREIISYFVADLSATQIANLSGVSRNSINKYLMGVRQRIYAFCIAYSPFRFNYNNDNLYAIILKLVRNNPF